MGERNIMKNTYIFSIVPDARYDTLINKNSASGIPLIPNFL